MEKAIPHTPKIWLRGLVEEAYQEPVRALEALDLSECAIFYRLHQRRDRVVPAHACSGASWVPGAMQVHEGLFGEDLNGETLKLISRCPPAERNRFVSRDETNIQASPAFIERVWEGFEIGEQVRMLAFEEDGSFLGWLGLLLRERDGRLDAKPLRELNRLASTLREHIRRARDAERAVARSLAAHLHIVLHDDGQVMFANREPDLLMDFERLRQVLKARLPRGGELRPGEETTLAVGDYVLGAERLAGPGGCAWLVTVEEAPPIRLSSLARLSKGQLEVAELAAEGYSVKEMAARLDRAPETVRSHLKRVYDRLDVANRAQLAQTLRDG